MIEIVEAHQIEGEPVSEHGRVFIYFGVARDAYPGFWPWSNPKIEWNRRFYATSDGTCYNFITGEHMPRTTECFQNYLAQNVKAQDEEKYIKLLERAKKI